MAERTAKKWTDGLAASGQTPERIARLRASVDMAVYTPGSSAGRPLAMLESLEAPSAAVLDDPEARRERIESLVSGILALAGIETEPGRSREHVLVSAIVDAIWRSGQKLDFGALVRAIPAPPIERVGFLDLENFYPAGERFQLASRLNTVAAAPGFDAWLTGEPLDVGLGEDEKLRFVDRTRVDPADPADDQLQRAGVELRRALDPHIVALVKRREILVGGVPHPAGDRPAAIGQFDLQVELPVAVGPQLLLRGEKNLVDARLRPQFGDAAPAGLLPPAGPGWLREFRARTGV
ncbi:MAG: hypothetical protein WCJ31_21765 [Planctomycetia bacterium]